MKFSKIPREIKIAEFKNSEGMLLYRSEKHTIAFITFRFSPQFFYSSIKTTLSETTETGVIQSKIAISQLVSNLINAIMKDIGGCISVIEDLYFNLEISLETGEVDFCFKIEGESLEDVQRKKLFLEEKLKNYINLEALVPLRDQFLLNFYFKSINTNEIKTINIEKIENSKLLKIYHREFEDKTTTFHLFIHFNKKIEEINANTISQMLNSLRAFGLNGFLNIYIQLGKKALFETQYFLQLFGKSKKFKEHVDIVLNQTNSLKYCMIHDPTVFDIKDLIWRRIPEGGIPRLVNLLNTEEELIVKQFLQTYLLQIHEPSFQKIYSLENESNSKSTFEHLGSEIQQFGSINNNHMKMNTLDQNNTIKANLNIEWNTPKKQDISFDQDFNEWDQSLSQINQMMETNEYYEYDNEMIHEYKNNTNSNENTNKFNNLKEDSISFLDEQLSIPMVPEKKTKNKTKFKDSESNEINIPQLNKNFKMNSVMAPPSKPNLPPTNAQKLGTNSTYPKPNLSPICAHSSQRNPPDPLNAIPNLPPIAPQSTSPFSAHNTQRDAPIVPLPKPNLPPTAPQSTSSFSAHNTQRDAPIVPPPKPNLPPTAPQSTSPFSTSASIENFDENVSISENFHAHEVPQKSDKEEKTIYENSIQDGEMEQDIIEKTFKFESFEELIQPKENDNMERIVQILEKTGLSFRQLNAQLFELTTIPSHLYIFTGESLAPLIRTIWEYKDKIKNMIIIFDDHKSLVKYYHRIGLTKYPFIYAFISEKFTEDALRNLKLSNKRMSAQQII